MYCRDCPYGREDFQFQIDNYNRIVSEQDIPNKVYGNMQLEDAAEEAEQFIWCDKVGGKVFYYGHCSDYAKDDKPTKVHSNKKEHRNRRERDIKYKKHLKWLSENINKYPTPAYYKDWVRADDYWIFDNPDPYYKRNYRGNHKNNRYKYYKRYANRAVRRYKGEIHKGGSYKKIFDYWWEVN